MRGYGGAKGIGYPPGPVAGGALVAVGGYPALFGMMAVIATVTVTAALVPSAPPGARTRPAPGLGRRLTSAAFPQPVLPLAAATAALPAGVGFLPGRPAQPHQRTLTPGRWPVTTGSA